MRQILIIWLGLCFQSALGVGHSRSIGLCTSNIYCIGDLLHTVQLTGLFQDSKTFVDMPSRFNEIQVLDNFSKLSSKNRTQLRKFVEDNFYENGHEVVEMDPGDWTPEPSYTKKIKDKTLRSFSIDLNLKWKNLLKMFDRSRICSDCESSAILTNNSFIVPGGRFNEYYYWDSYWVIEALLISGMTNTAKGMILNFVDILRLNGFVPNGARVYYLNRSQPPLLIQMVHVYYKFTKDIEFLRAHADLLDKEYEFWIKYKSVDVFKNGEVFKLNQYRVVSDRPRPESYKEDFLNGEESGNASKYYSNVMSAAESGWDFSSRWFEDPMDIRTILIDKIVPVDLNSILYKNERIMQEFHQILGNGQKVERYKSLADLRQRAINSVFWDPVAKSYGDYNYETDKVQTQHLYITDLAPLWFNVTPPVDEEIVLKRYKSILFDYVSGIPASNVNTHQQWDFPNVWAPYHHWTVEYLIRSNRVSQGLNIAQRFVNTVYCGWKKTMHIYEKYDAQRLGEYGQGGEYVVQEGFGWTNGVAISFLNHFSDDLLPSCDKNVDNFSKKLNGNFLLVFIFIGIFFVLNKF